MKKGEIRIVEIPLSNGHEQAGNRPVIVLHESEAPICIIIPLTSNLTALKYLNSILIEPSNNNGLEIESVALVFQIRAIDKIRMKN
jgi:mRNA interferase MazF